MRVLAGIFAGFLAGLVAFLAISYLGDAIFPMSSEVDARDPEQVSSAFSSAPFGAKLMLLAALFAGAFAAVWVADSVSLRHWTGWPLVILLTLFAVGIVFMVTLPVWMQVALPAAALLGAFAAGHALPGRIVSAEERSDAAL